LGLEQASNRRFGSHARGIVARRVASLRDFSDDRRMNNGKDLGPRFWPLRWIADEKFWRDVVSQALGAFVVLFVGFAWAATSGWLNPSVPVAAARWGALSVGIVLGIVAVVMVLLVIGSAREMQRREGKGRQYAVVTSLLFAAMLGLVAIPYIVGLVRGTMFGTSL
jgi:hypothetical protein